MNCLGGNFVKCVRIPFTPTKNLNKLVSTKNTSLHHWLVTTRRGKSQFFLQMAQNRTLSTKVLQTLLLLSTPSTTLRSYAKKKIENLEIFQNVNIEFINLFKNNSTTNLLIFDDSFEKIRNSKDFGHIATAERHRGLSNVCFKHSIVHQSKLGRDVELQNTHFVLFKSPFCD